MSQTKWFHLDVLRTYSMSLSIPYHPFGISKVMLCSSSKGLRYMRKATEEKNSSYSNALRLHNNEDNNDNIYYIPGIMLDTVKCIHFF